MRLGRLAFVVGPWILTACLGGSTYRVEGAEAQRAVRELGQSESTVVEATDRFADRRVRLSLKRGDEVELTRRGPDDHEVTTEPLWRNDSILDPEAVESFDFHSPTPRENWLMAGIFTSAIAVIAPAISAIQDGKPVYAIPFVGPGAMLAAKKRDFDCRQTTVVGCIAGSATVSMVDTMTVTVGACWLGLQVLALGITAYGIWGAEPSRDLGDAPPQDSAVHWPAVTFAPTPGGGAGLQVLGTF